MKPKHSEKVRYGFEYTVSYIIFRFTMFSMVMGNNGFADLIPCIGYKSGEKAVHAIEHDQVLNAFFFKNAHAAGCVVKAVI